MKKVRTFERAASFILVTALFTFCDTSTMLNETAPTSGSYTLTYHANGATSGTAPAAEKYNAQAIVTVSGNTGGLIKTDHTFTGWNTKTDGSGTTYAQGQSFTMKKANLVLYARWKNGMSFTVTYDANGATSGSVPFDSTYYEAGTTVTVRGNSGGLAKSGFIFSGWNTKADGTGTTYTQSQTFAMGSSNIVLYARWTNQPTYKVTYVSNGATSGNVPIDSTNYETGMTVTVLGNTGGLVKAGSIFAGWNTQADGNGTGYAAGATFTMGSANVTLYAKWSGFAFPATITVMKGTLLTNPDQPQRMTYVYIDSARDLYAIESTDGGATWGSPNRATYSADLFDFAAAMDGSSTTLVETVRGPSVDGAGGIAEWTSLVAGAWTGINNVYSAGGGALCRLPSVFRVNGSTILFGIGYDTGGGGAGDDTNAFSLYWNGSTMAGPYTVGLHPQTDNPSYVQQIFGSTDGTTQYLYMDNHSDWTSGDTFIVPGASYTSWLGSGSETLLIDITGNSFQPFLFQAPSGVYILVYTVNNGSSHSLFMKYGGSIPALAVATPSMLSQAGNDVKDISEGTGIYHTIYATQEPSSGAIHVVWEDKAEVGKIWRARIDPAAYTGTTYEDITDTGTLDGVSALSGTLYVSLHDSGTLAAKVVWISVP